MRAGIRLHGILSGGIVLVRFYCTVTWATAKILQNKLQLALILIHKTEN